jgi:hypothetical protein
MKVQLKRNFQPTNMKAWKKDITKLSVKKMEDNDYLKKPVERIASILLQLIEKGRAYSKC